MGLDLGRHSALLCGLARAADANPTADKLILCRPRGVGRELLHALARAGCGWLGFRAQTPRDLAKELAAEAMGSSGLTPMDGFDELALLDEAIDAVLATPAGAPLRPLGESAGFRDVLAGSLRELRLAGLEASAVARCRLEERDKRDALAAIQAYYERALGERSLADLAGLLRLAVESLDPPSNQLPADHVYIVPGSPARGLVGALLERLLTLGAEVLPQDPVRGLEPPASTLYAGDDEDPTTNLAYLFAADKLPEPGAPKDLFSKSLEEIKIDLFAAASPVDELREALRRIVSAGIPWDDVEIVATDRVVYGTVLDSIAPRLTGGSSGGSRVTHAAGLPLARTRIGRAITQFLRWIQEDFPDDIMRTLLQSDLLRAEYNGHRVGAARAARLLRDLRIGWSRTRYRRQLAWALESLQSTEARHDTRVVSEEDLAARKERRRLDLTALDRTLGAILDAIPPTPDRLGVESEPVSPASVATAIEAFLRFVPTQPEPDIEAEAKRRILDVLHRTKATLRRKTGFRAAVATLERFIDLRVPSPSTHGRVPWSSAAGYLHFSDLDHGGLSGRPHTFVVGLDAGRFPGFGRQHALLLDHDRGRLSAQLPISADVLDENRYALAALLARLRGTVTLSYSAWDASQGRKLSPSPLLLQAFRLRQRDPRANYKQLEEQTHPLAGPVPSSTGVIDANDLWLEALDQDGVLRRGTEVVRGAFPNLDAGLLGREIAQTGVLSAFHGAVSPRPDLLDPRRVPETRLSASRLETLARCPRRYFFSYVLGIREPDDLSFEADQWLDARQRGSMFHHVYESTLKQAAAQGIDVNDDAFVGLAEEVLTVEIDRAARQVPIPSRAVQEREVTGLRHDLDVFIAMLRADQPRWIDAEWEFGFDDEVRGAARLELPSGEVFLRGAVDRVDELEDNKLRIVDYKTGGTYDYRDGTGTYDGGRRLQHALYTAAIEQHLQRRVEVAEYHCPTVKGEGSRFDYARERLSRWPEILENLFDLIGDGLFLAPPDKEAPCKFCDYRAICRVSERFGKLISPPVEWARNNAHLLEQFEPLLRVRRIDE